MGHYEPNIVTRDFDFITVTQRRDWQGTGSGQLMRRPSDRLPFALQQSERKALPATILSPTAGLSSPIILPLTFILGETKVT